MLACEITYLWYSFQQYDCYRFYDFINDSCSSFWISNEWKCLCFYRGMVTYDGFNVFYRSFGGKFVPYNKIYECCNKPFVFSDVVIFRSNDSGRSISGWSSCCNQMDATGNWNWYIKKGVHWLFWWYTDIGDYFTCDCSNLYKCCCKNIQVGVILMLKPDIVIIN